jgi:hypothetical protein
MDAFTGFCKSFDGYRDNTFVTVTWLNSNGSYAASHDITSQIAHAASVDRSWIQVRGTRTDEGNGRDEWEVTFDSRKGAATTQFRIMEDSNWVGSLPEKLRESIERFTAPMSRKEMRKARPLLEPISLDDAVQRDHDNEISARAARVGLWGAIAGAVLGAVFGALASWLVAENTGGSEPTPTPTPSIVIESLLQHPS